jgi:signal transduction histidine kinase
MPTQATKTVVETSAIAFTLSTVESGDWSKDLIAIQEGERRRISQELHDDLGQRLALLEIKIDQLEHRGLPPDVAKGLRNVKSLIGEMDRDIHRICYELYPVVLEKLGLVAGLDSLCRDFSEVSGIETTFEHNKVPKHVDENASLCLYRVAQEALHNISKHSGSKRALVSLKQTDIGLQIVIADFGIGFDPFQGPPRKGLGLTTIAQRVRGAGGHCSIHSTPGVGTEVYAILYEFV